MNTVLDNKCISCGSPIVLDPVSGKFKCSHCNSIFTAEELKNMDNSKEKIDVNDVNIDDEYVTYNCPDCGASIIADKETAATFCIYCGNSSIIKNRLTGKFAPSKIIPFKKVKEDAIEAFKKLKKGHPLVPNEFVSEKNIEKIKGVYIPFWLYDLSSDGKLDVKATKVSKWVVGDTHYTKTDYYNVKREASMSFSKIPVDGSTRFADDIMNTIEPFDYSELVDYNHAYLSGFLAEKYNVESNDAYIAAKERAIKSSEEIMMNDINGYVTRRIQSKDIKEEINNTDYVLLPVYMVNVKYKDKFYLFAMNGQTGEFVGNIPVSIKKTIIFGIISFIVSFVIVVLMSLLIYSIGG